MHLNFWAADFFFRRNRHLCGVFFDIRISVVVDDLKPRINTLATTHRYQESKKKLFNLFESIESNEDI